LVGHETIVSSWAMKFLLPISTEIRYLPQDINPCFFFKMNILIERKEKKKKEKKIN
jgi:hypothetical protein